MTCFTLILSYYENPKMLEENIRIWNGYSQKVKDNMNIIIVDDGSPTFPALQVLCKCKMEKLRIRLFRIKDNIPWNQDGARNLALYHTQGFCLLTDIDHVLGDNCALEILNRNDWKKDTIYFLHRIFSIDEQEKRKKQNKADAFFTNLYFMHAELFWHIGGYNESFVGRYGSDRMFRKKLEQNAIPFEHVPKSIYLRAYTSSDIHDSYTFDFDRSLPSKKEFKEMEKRNLPILNFEWEEIQL